MKILVSSCLLGNPTRYDGKSKYSKEIEPYLEGNEIILVCPEVLGGLSVPRKPCERVGDKILTEDGEDKTREYLEGAKMVVETVRREKVDLVILKSNSPSCGVGKIYDGTFTGNLVDGNGVLGEMLIKLRESEGLNFKILTI